MASNSRGTILMTKGYDPVGDAERLKIAMDGTGTNDKSIIDILGHRTNAQRQSIKEAYTRINATDLEQDLKEELDGEFENLLCAMLTNTAEFDAELLYKSCKGLGTDEDLLIEVLCTRTRFEMEKIKEAYFKKYDDSVSKLIKGDTSGDFWKFCEKLLERGGSHESGSADRTTAKNDALKLYQHGEGMELGYDGDVFIDMFTAQPYAHLRLVFEEYEKVTDRTIEEAIESQFSGDFRLGMLTLVECIRNTPRYFAKKLHKALTKREFMPSAISFSSTSSILKLTGWHDHSTTIRVVVSRAEIDLDDIKVEFMKLFRKTLGNCVEEEIRGPYRRMLLEIIRN